MLLKQKWDSMDYENHRFNLKTAKHNIDNVSPATYAHLYFRPKKLQLEMERFCEIQRDNSSLLKRIATIQREGGWIDHKNFYKSKSLNTWKRQQEMIELAYSNQIILSRLLDCHPKYSKSMFDDQYLLNLKYKANVGKFPNDGRNVAEQIKLMKKRIKKKVISMRTGKYDQDVERKKKERWTSDIEALEAKKAEKAAQKVAEEKERERRIEKERSLQMKQRREEMEERRRASQKWREAREERLRKAKKLQEEQKQRSAEERQIEEERQRKKREKIKRDLEKWKRQREIDEENALKLKAAEEKRAAEKERKKEKRRVDDKKAKRKKQLEASQIEDSGNFKKDKSIKGKDTLEESPPEKNFGKAFILKEKGKKEKVDLADIAASQGLEETEEEGADITTKEAMPKETSEKNEEKGKVKKLTSDVTSKKGKKIPPKKIPGKTKEEGKVKETKLTYNVTTKKGKNIQSKEISEQTGKEGKVKKPKLITDVTTKKSKNVPPKEISEKTKEDGKVKKSKLTSDFTTKKGKKTPPKEISKEEGHIKKTILPATKKISESSVKKGKRPTKKGKYKAVVGASGETDENGKRVEKTKFPRDVIDKKSNKTNDEDDLDSATVFDKKGETEEVVLAEMDTKDIKEDEEEGEVEGLPFEEEETEDEDLGTAFVLDKDGETKKVDLDELATEEITDGSKKESNVKKREEKTEEEDEEIEEEIEGDSDTDSENVSD